MFTRLTIDTRPEGNRVEVSRSTGPDDPADYDTLALTVTDALAAASLPRTSYAVAKIVEWAAEMELFIGRFGDRLDNALDAMYRDARDVIEFWDEHDKRLEASFRGNQHPDFPAA